MIQCRFLSQLITRPGSYWAKTLNNLVECLCLFHYTRLLPSRVHNVESSDIICSLCKKIKLAKDLVTKSMRLFHSFWEFYCVFVLQMSCPDCLRHMVELGELRALCAQRKLPGGVILTPFYVWQTTKVWQYQVLAWKQTSLPQVLESKELLFMVSISISMFTFFYRRD